MSDVLNRRLRGSDHSLDPYFSVKRERLLTSSGEYVGFDALINSKLNKTLSVVGESYHFVPHKTASQTVHDFLDATKLNYVIKFIRTAANGAQYFEVIEFPDLKFEVLPKGKDTSLDADKHKPDEYVPTITVRSSYDKSYPTQFAYGAFRYICINGVMVGIDISKLSIRHNQKLVVGDVQNSFEENLEKSIESLKVRIPELNELEGQEFAEEFLFNRTLPAKFKKDIVEMAGPAISSYYDTMTSPSGRTKQVLKSIDTDMSAYAVMNIITSLVSHKAKNAAKQQGMYNMVAKVFDL